MERQNFDFTTVINIFKKNFKVFLIVVIAVSALAIVFSGPYFLKPLYKSMAIVYPINIKTYSDESETEQLLQMFRASAIEDTIIKKFDLYKRYGITEGGRESKYYMSLEYSDRIMSSKTSYESVRLEVFDESPDTAKLIADEILHQLNLKIRSLYNQRGLDRARAFKRQMDHQKELIDSIQVEISKLAQDKGLLQYEGQTRELLRSYFATIDKAPNSERSKEMRERLENLQTYGSTLQALQEISNFAAEQYGEITFKYLEWRAIGQEDVNYIDVIVHPDVADKKAWPIRWLILVLSNAIAVLITLIVLAAAKKH